VNNSKSKPRFWRWVAVVLAMTCSSPLSAKVFDGGVDSNNLGKGEWIYVLSSLFGSYVPSVTDVPSLMAYCATNLHCQFVVIKAGTGSTNYPSASNPQFTSSVVSNAHAWGLKIFGYTRSYGGDVPGEIAIANYVFNCGADGFVLDAETEWESSTAVGGSSVVGTNGPTLAMQLCGGIKTNWPTKFLGHSPFAIISYHSTFPYPQFGYWCDAVMPQDYWVDFGKTPTATVQWMDSNWGPWQNGLSGMWTNAIKPLAPIGEADNTNQPGTDITEFVNYLSTDPGCVTAGGYNGCVFFRPGLQTPVMLGAIAAASIGPGAPPFITAQPQSQTVVTGANASFSVTATGAAPLAYQWRLNGQSISNATSSAYTRTNVQPSDAGPYSVIVSNSNGTATSSNAVLAIATNFVPPADIIIDNTNVNFTTTGSWTLGTSAADKYGPSYEYAGTVSGAATATATFTPDIVTAGNYDVFTWYPEGSNRTTNAPWSIVSSNGTANFTINQQINGGQWLTMATNLAFSAGTGGYVRVANNAGPTVVLADAVKLSYSPVQPPAITASPKSLSAWLGGSASFSVQATAYGASSFTYQWKCNGTNISGATGSAYTISGVQSNNAGNYSVMVSDAAGSSASSPAAMTVVRPVISFNFIKVLPGGQVHLQLGGDPVNVTLQTSADFSDWVESATGSLANGPADFYVPATNKACFYRAQVRP
jgi:hypothetical protein